MIVVVAASFTGALVYRTGGVSELMKPRAHPVRAGSFEFTYPDRWKRMPKKALPGSANTAVHGAVVAGLCPAAAGRKGGKGTAGCAASVDLTYVLFQEGEKAALPGTVGALGASFDRTFPARFPGFRKVESSTRLTADGVRYLRYEFTFGKGKSRVHEIVGAYDARDGVVLVVAQGPDAEFAKHRDSVIAIMDGARERDAGGSAAAH